MNSDQLGGVIRSLIIAVGGLFIGHGVFVGVDQATLSTAAGAVATLVGIIWSIKSNSTAAIVASAKAKAPVAAPADASNSTPAA
jgi:hypothetical protein